MFILEYYTVPSSSLVIEEWVDIGWESTNMDYQHKMHLSGSLLLNAKQMALMQYVLGHIHQSWIHLSKEKTRCPCETSTMVNSMALTASVMTRSLLTKMKQCCVSHLGGLRRARADLDRVENCRDPRDRPLCWKCWSRVDKWRAVSKRWA